jgi:hypothetical protein
LNAPGESLGLTALNVLLSSAVILGLYLAPMYLVGHWHVRAIVCLGVATIAAAVLYFTWYRTLPSARATR